MNRILIPLDGSEFSAQILAVVRKFFVPDSCELILYRVVAPVEGFTGIPPYPAGPGISVPMYDTSMDLELAEHPIYASQQEDSDMSHIADDLEPLAQELRGAGYTVSVKADIGIPAEAIIERAHAGDIQLIALTTHGRSGISRLLFGSIAEQIVRHVSIPVLLLRPTPNA